jgi:hypothetical protein
LTYNPGMLTEEEDKTVDQPAVGEGGDYLAH